jgi:hypothetical protein
VSVSSKQEAEEQQQEQVKDKKRISSPSSLPTENHNTNKEQTYTGNPTQITTEGRRKKEEQQRKHAPTLKPTHTFSFNEPTHTTHTLAINHHQDQGPRLVVLVFVRVLASLHLHSSRSQSLL